MGEGNHHTIRNTLRHIGYAAAFVSGSAAAVYTLSSALRRHDLSAIWMLDKRAAPPVAIQRELQDGPCGSESDDASDGEVCREAQRELKVSEERQRLEAKMTRAVQTGNMQRVQEVASQINDLQNEQKNRPHTQEQRLRSNDGQVHSNRASHKRNRSLAEDSYDQHSRQHPRSSTVHQGTRRDGNTRQLGSADEYDNGSFGGVQPCARWSTLVDRRPQHRSSRGRSPCVRDEFRSSFANYSGDEEQRMRVRRQDSDSTYGVQPEIDDAESDAPHISARHMQRSGHCDGAILPGERMATSHTTAQQTKEPRAPSRKRAAETPVSASVLDAESKLKAGDLIRAECPFTHELHDATVRAVRGRGLVEVRWHNPGTDEHGRPFSRYGDVWADKVSFVFRKDTAQSTELTLAPTASEQHEPTTLSSAPQAEEFVEKDDCAAHLTCLKVGDECFACGSMLELKWFKARVLAVRSKSPTIRVEYLATFDGETMPLMLPEPRKAFVHEEQVRREKPAQAIVSANMPKPSVLDAADAPLAEQATSKGHELEDSGDAIDEDLMCSVCARPDDEACMLVCDCKKGFHIYCLTPKLDTIPEGDWKCPECSAAAHA